MTKTTGTREGRRQMIRRVWIAATLLIMTLFAIAIAVGRAAQSSMLTIANALLGRGDVARTGLDERSLVMLDREPIAAVRDINRLSVDAREAVLLYRAEWLSTAEPELRQRINKGFVAAVEPGKGDASVLTVHLIPAIFAPRASSQSGIQFSPGGILLPVYSMPLPTIAADSSRT